VILGIQVIIDNKYRGRRWRYIMAIV
jgi:hypothetical protein